MENTERFHMPIGCLVEKIDPLFDRDRLIHVAFMSNGLPANAATHQPVRLFVPFPLRSPVHGIAQAARGTPHLSISPDRPDRRPQVGDR